MQTSDDDSADSAPTSAGMGASDETNLLPPAAHAGPAADALLDERGELNRKLTRY
jgi:hypothetical protein